MGALQKTLLVGLGLFLAIQLVPVERSNPPVLAEVPAPPEVREVIERACYDCHSNETRWPWYAQLAPASWLLAYDVAEAREHMNFSDWKQYDEDEQRDLVEEAWEEVEEGEMPPWFYLPLHPEARLSDADRGVLQRWAEAAGE
ncbi:MAG: heme-binding domain-containing protein [Myxococcota bacterium]|nr:heme-binding domain-containing protein [Myxococcota bacterium]